MANASVEWPPDVSNAFTTAHPRGVADCRSRSWSHSHAWRDAAGTPGGGTLRAIFLEFERDDWEQELAAFWHTDVELPATLTMDGKTYPDVGVSFRGNN